MSMFFHTRRSNIALFPIALFAVFSSLNLWSQDADDSDEEETDEITEEVVVYGIRGSMQQSLDRKRMADHFKDTITAEDIGLFPDQNLAEALQRVSGVAIDRKSGEGAYVSVRGLGPNFVQTTINGRVSASNVSPGSHDGRGATNAGSRVVGFHSFQSGLVQAVEVHKSPRADHVEGGLGGFVDVQARRPFDLGDRHLALNFDTTINELADDSAPGVFALFSDVLNEKVGFMASAQWDNRVFRSDSLHHWSYVGDPRTVNINGVEMTGYYPRQLLGELHLTDRDRLNVSSALQLRPSDRVDVTLDVLYTSNQADETDFWRDFRLQQGHARITDAELKNDNGTGVFTRVSTSGAGLFIQHATEVVDTEAMNIGGKIEIQASDRLTLHFDATLSRTESPITNRDYLVRNTRTQMTYHKYGPGGLPSLSTTDPINDPDFFEVVKHSIQDHLVDDQIMQMRADATFNIDGEWLETLQFGVRTYDQDRRDRHRYLNSRAFIRHEMSEFGGSIPFPAEDDFLDGLGITFPSPAVTPNLDVIQRTFTTRPDEILAGAGFNTGTAKALGQFNTGRFNEDLNHDDDGTAFYGMLTFTGMFGNTPYSGNVGVRYVDNSTGSQGEITEPLTIDYSDETAPEIILSDPVYVEIGHDYSRVLPSLNLRFDPREDVVVRASLAKVMSRPRYLDLNPRQSVQARARTMRGGNGELDPTMATQFDLAFEWYFADYSIAQIGFFAKNIESFVQPDLELVPFAGLTDPATNQPLVFTLFRPLNTGESSLTGFELAFQRTFEDILQAPFDGLGVVANWTAINSGSDFRNEKTNASYGIPGLSDNTVNFTVFYEKNRIAARLSYNFRSDFLDVIADGQGHPYFVDAYKQIDASIGFNLSERIALSFEAINLQDENVYYYNLLGTGTEEHISGGINAGRRFQFGVRVKM